MSPKAKKAVTQLTSRISELREHHIGPLGQAVTSFLQRREERQQEREQEVEDLLTQISTEPEQSSSTPKTEETEEKLLQGKIERARTEQPGTFGWTKPTVSVTPEQAMTFDAAAMSQPQLQKSIDYIKGRQQEMMEAGDYSPKSVEVYRQLATRLDELNKYHRNWVENLFRTDNIPQVN